MSAFWTQLAPFLAPGNSFVEVALCMNDQLDHLSRWIAQSKMQLNCSKSSVMWFSMKHICTAALPAISVNNTVLKIVSHQKYLGIIFDNKLQWSLILIKSARICLIICIYDWLTLHFFNQVCIQDVGRITGIVSYEIYYFYGGTSTPAEIYFMFTADAE